MKKISILIIILTNISFIFAQNENLEKTTKLIKNRIESMCSQFGSEFTVIINDCTMNIYETMTNAENKIDTVNYYHIDLSNIPDTITYSKKERLGTTKISIVNPGMYMISYFKIDGTFYKKRTDNMVILPFKTKHIDRIKFVNDFDNALQKAKSLCQ